MLNAHTSVWLLCAKNMRRTFSAWYNRACVVKHHNHEGAVEDEIKVSVKVNGVWVGVSEQGAMADRLNM